MRGRYLSILLLCVLSLFPVKGPRADTIILNDGRKLEGTIIEEGADYYKVKIKIGTMKVTRDMVKEVKKLAPEENFTNLGNQLMAAGKYDAAIEQYDKALKANPSYGPAKVSLENAEKAKNESEAKVRAAQEQKDKDAAKKKDKLSEGFGFTLEPSGDTFVIASISPGSKAESLGLKVKDEIVQANDFRVKGKSLDDVIGYLTGADNSQYTLTIQRECGLTRKKIDYQKHSFVGVGIFLDSTGDGLVINSVIVGEPADLSGLKSRDRVVSIEGKPASGMSVDDAAAVIGGTEGSKLKITIQRPIEIERK